MSATTLPARTVRRWPLTRVSRRGLATALVWLFVVLTVVLPAGPPNKIVFAALFGWMVLEMLFDRARPVVLVPAAFVVQGILVYGFILSFLNESDAALARQFVMAGMVLFLVHFVRHHRIDLDRPVLHACVALLAATLLFEATLRWPDLPMMAQASYYLEYWGLSSNSQRDFGGTPTPSVHMGTAPFLFVGFSLCLVQLVETRRWAWGLLLFAICVGILFSASRGLWAVSLMFLAFVMTQRLHTLLRVLVIVLAVPIGLVAIDFLFTHTLLLSIDEVSNAGKFGHLTSYFDDLTLGSLLGGRGLAAYYLSTGSMVWTPHTEITQLDMARYVGVIFTFVLYLVILFPTARLRRYTGSNQYGLMTMALYIVLSATNPVMFNSYGLLVVLWYWARVLPPERE